MNQLFIKTLKRLALICASVLSLGGSALHAEPYFIHKDGAMVLDKATGLVWMRCSVGQTWSGFTCTGMAKEYTFNQAQQLSDSEWRVPTIRELASLIYCSSGQMRDRDNPGDGGADIPNDCKGSFTSPAIRVTAFPKLGNKPYWSSSIGGSGEAWVVGFGIGGLSKYERAYTHNVRLVRINQFSGDEVGLGYVALDAAMATENSRQEEMERSLRQRQEIVEKTERAQETAAWRKLIASGVQNMYLQAAKEQKNGSDTKAEKIYEAIIEKYPNSPFAVKASDQLTAMGRSARQVSSGRQIDSGQQANQRQICEAQKQSCLASCGTQSVYNGREYVSNWSYGPCTQRCNQINCN